MSRRRRGLSALLATALAAGGIALAPVSPASAATVVADWASLRAAVNNATEDVTVELGATINNPAGQNLSVPTGVTVTLDLGTWNLTIDGLGNYAPGIRVTSGAALVVDGTTGRLTAKGGPGAAGLGGGSATDHNGETAGSITIRGGEVRATGGDAVPPRGAGAAGIGGGGGGNATGAGPGNGGAGGTITITGGVVVATAVTTNTVRDGAGIGGGGGAIGTSTGNGRSGAGAQVTITGGSVTATGGSYASGIGSGGGYQAGTAGTISVQGVAAAGSVTTSGVRGPATSFTRAATIVATGTPSDHVFRAARAGVANSVRIDYPDAVVFDTDGGTSITPLALAPGSLVSEPPAPTRVGHTFVGWFADAALTTAWDFASDTTASGTTIIYAGWTVNSYPVTFDANGGTPVPPVSVDYGTPVPTPSSPTREGHTFAGWFADAALTTPWDFVSSTMPASAITLYAQWSINSYPVTFESNGGSAVPEQSVAYDTLVSEPDAPSREGHTFTGWYADAALTVPWDFTADAVPASAITLYASWSINSYPVTFDVNGGSTVPGRTLVYGSLVSRPEDPTREGYTFAGWFADAAFTVPWNFAADTVPGSPLVLHAKWSVNSYLVSFVSNGGSAVASQIVDYGTAVAEPAVPSREGYTFAGWFTDAALATAWDFDSDTMPASAITLYARWSINDYLVSFDENGGTIVANQTVEYAALVAEPVAPTREGHTFAGWYADGALTVPWDFDVDRVPAHEITLHAAWVVNSYLVSFDSTGGSFIAPRIVEYGTSVPEPAAPTREGHTFVGWFADAAFATGWDFDADTMPASAITLYAKWAVNSYFVSFEPNGGSAVTSRSVDYGSLLAEPVPPLREGHTFVGWFADAALTTPWDFATEPMPASDVTLYAKWTINSYLVSFATDEGTEVAPRSVAYRALVPEPVEPSREGHTFVGWFADAALTTPWDFATGRMPASDVTLYAKWSINSYLVTFDAAGGTAVPEQSVEYGSPIVVPATPTRAGYVFAGWFSGWSAWGDDIPVRADVQLTARWTPMVVEVVPGSRQVLVRWDTMALPEGEAARYEAVVEPGGLRCATTTTACAVTGLAPGAYSVVLTAHWPDSAAISDTVAFDVVDLAMPGDAPTESTESITLTLLSRGEPVAAAVPGARLTVAGSGFVPGSNVELVVYSTPVPLATAAADANGEISVAVLLPAGLELGPHTVVARGFSADARDGGYGVAALRIVEPALSSTGVDAVRDLLVPLLVMFVLMALGAASVLAGRRRRARTTEIGG